MTKLTDIDLFARLVAFDTTSANSNLQMSEFLCGYLERAGVRIDRNASVGLEKVNLILRMGPDPGPDRRGLILSGHMDVVPAGQGWDSDPFTLTARDDRFVARGAADMKGFLALAVNIFAAAEPDRLAAPLALVLTYDEELGCLGAERMFRTWPREDLLPRNTVIGEPTTLKVVRMHKGHMKLRATLRGINAHSGYPHRGVNAIEPAGRVITALAALREELEKERSPNSEHFTEAPFVALNVAVISGGLAVNIVPDRCRIDVGLRPLPGMKSGPLVQRVKEAVRTAAGAARFDFELSNDGPAMMLSENAPIYRALCRMTGQQKTVGVSYCTDAGWFQQMGLDCAVFGPGSIEVAHKPNEFLPRAEFEQARNYLRRLVEESCLA